MIPKPPLLTIVAIFALLVPVRLHAVVSFSWASVGDTGNAADPLNSGSAPGIGSVASLYSIATTEVNLSQYTEFLNAVDPNGLNTNSLYNASLATETNIVGISFTSGAASGSKYAVIGSGLRPVTYVSWNDAARFVNWLHNGQGAGSTESGVYDMGLATPTRSLTAGYWVPSENEWYKAAYYQPVAQGGDTDSYWLYPTASNTITGNTIGVANSANFLDGDYAKDQNGLLTYLTDGGTYTNSPSFYGTYDQGGNVWEWNDTAFEGGSKRGLRGGSWRNNDGFLRSTLQNGFAPTLEDMYLGFRVASVPEPSTALLLMPAGLACLLRKRRRTPLWS